MSDKLFSDFPEVSAKAWKQQIQYDLKGADYNETLVWESPEGIKVKPFYHQEDISKLNLQSVNNKDWKIGQVVYAGNAAMANAKARDFLQKGAECILFQIPSAAIKIEELLKNLNFENTPIYFELHFLSADYVNGIKSHLGNAASPIFLNIDIIGNLARSGNWFEGLEKDHSTLTSILDMDLRNTLQVDLSLYQNAGATITQQLAYGLAHANEYLNHFQSRLENSSGFTMHFKVAVGTNYFFEIAKLRALRILWSTLASEYGITTACHISAYPTKRNKTLYDYNTNMLRSTTECMSAILGGADVVFNLPYDAIYHKNNEFGDRIALNQLILLKEESHFDKVGNPADGTFYIESLTHQIAEKALQLFKNLEKQGGFLKQLKAHVIQKQINESAAKEQERFNTKTEVLVGTNTYVNSDDRMKDNLELYPFLKSNTRKTLIAPIFEKRLAEAMEQKRLKDE
ncbi:methylmalonyl-CoA mutase subunit beta [Maribacter aestuarii]|uniref:methylmalonyl-CoA mutase subunit beta n=1 Tax=Maribacter aestuarii TaxID=1130723 RepID=UPI00248C7B17|nr:methylmalonyl-CoA mutase subunit beta [Maribacter aestuarii]